MDNIAQAFGFSFFSSSDFMIQKKVRDWLPALQQIGASTIIFKSDFDRAIPEDMFISAQKNGLIPIVHFSVELPLARKFNEASFLMDIYAKWGVNEVILGDRPNIKASWTISGWHYEKIADHFLSRFIPLANHAIRVGLTPVLPPLHPGGDYWDTAFIELVLSGLKKRQLDIILDSLVLSSYGYTFNKPLTWGSGGPERWSGVKPYQTAEGQEDQLGFHNYSWYHAIGLRATGKEIPTMILDAGSPGIRLSQPDRVSEQQDMRNIFASCWEDPDKFLQENNQRVQFGQSVKKCIFSMDTISNLIEENISPRVFMEFFSSQLQAGKTPKPGEGYGKVIDHYLLLPTNTSGISDVILNKIRPLIKHQQPTVGFSIKEAALAKKVSIYPNPAAFSDEMINELRSSGCKVEILPESGIEIATMAQES